MLAEKKTTSLSVSPVGTVTLSVAPLGTFVYDVEVVAAAVVLVAESTSATIARSGDARRACRACRPCGACRACGTRRALLAGRDLAGREVALPQ